MSPRTSARKDSDTTTVTVDGGDATVDEVTVRDDQPPIVDPPAEAPAEDGNGNGGYKPKRTATVHDEVPNKSRKDANYDVWLPDLNELREGELRGKRFEYLDVPNVSGLSQGLRRIYGCDAETRAVQKDGPNKGKGHLYLSWPVVRDDNGKIVPGEDGFPVIDTDAIAATKAKYSKS